MMLRNYITRSPTIIHALGTLSPGDYFIPVSDLVIGTGAQIYRLGRDGQAEVIRLHIAGETRERKDFDPTTQVIRVKG